MSAVVTRCFSVCLRAGCSRWRRPRPRSSRLPSRPRMSSYRRSSQSWLPSACPPLRIPWVLTTMRNVSFYRLLFFTAVVSKLKFAFLWIFACGLTGVCYWRLSCMMIVMIAELRLVSVCRVLPVCTKSYVVFDMLHINVENKLGYGRLGPSTGLNCVIYVHLVCSKSKGS